MYALIRYYWNNMPSNDFIRLRSNRTKTMVVDTFYVSVEYPSRTLKIWTNLGVSTPSVRDSERAMALREKIVFPLHMQGQDYPRGTNKGSSSIKSSEISIPR